MKNLISRSIQMRLVIFISILMSTPIWAADQIGSSDKWVPPNKYFIYLVVVLVLIGSFLAIALIRAALSQTKWSLAEALSEEVKVDTGEKDKDGKPIVTPRMGASSSRLIALMGMMVILLMFLGFGSFILFSFGITGDMPDQIGKIVHFLLAGLTLFAPYTVNKFASIFESLSPKPGA